MSEIQTLPFKSIPIYYDDEENGNKPYTIREIDDDWRFICLKRHWDNVPNKELYIELTNTSTGDKFKRRVTNIYYTKHNQVIISWKHSKTNDEVHIIEKKLLDEILEQVADISEVNERLKPIVEDIENKVTNINSMIKE